MEKTQYNRITNFMLKNSKTSIILVYNLGTFLGVIIFYPLIPILMGYPAEVMALDGIVGISYGLQYIALSTTVVLTGTVFLLILLRGIDNWKKAVDENNAILIRDIRGKCLNAPYMIFILQNVLIGISAPLIIGIICLINRTPFSQFLKISTVVFSFFSLAGVFSHVFSRKLYIQILLKTYNGEGLQGKRIGLRKRIFIQILPMFIVSILFITVLANSKLMEEKGDLFFELCQLRLNETLSEKSEFSSVPELFDTLDSIKFDHLITGYFAVNKENGDIVTSDGYIPGAFFSYLAKNPAPKGRVYGDSYEMQGVVKSVRINGEDYYAGIRFDNTADGSISILILAFFSLLAINTFALHYFSKSISDEILVVADSLNEIAESENVDADRHLAVISNDELGDLVVAFNKIQEREIKLIREMGKQQSIIIEREKLAQDALEKLKRIQTQMIHQEKLAGIGQLAAGVAHEINNPLGFVSSNIETLEIYVMKYEQMLDTYRNLINMVKNTTKDNLMEEINIINDMEKKNNMGYISDDVINLFTDVKDGINRISNIITGLRLFSRADRLNELSEYDLNIGINNTLLVANNEIKYYANVERELGNIPGIMANGGQINQVLLNIIVNAVHAIKQKNTSGLGLIKIRTYSDSKYVYCEIKDNGTGIPENIINQIFSPFFSTKPVGHGTGLGLSISYDIIVDKHKGELLAENNPEGGAKFTIKLPITPV